MSTDGTRPRPGERREHSGEQSPTRRAVFRRPPATGGTEGGSSAAAKKDTSVANGNPSAANGDSSATANGSPSAEAKARAKAKARRWRTIRMWIPQYHGGWAMVVVPPILGIVEGGFRWAHIPLYALWFIGYFFFYCATVWLRSHCKARYAAPVKAYGAAVLGLGLISLVCAPFLWRWALLFAPLVAVAALAAWKREDRSLASGLDTVAAASLMVPVMYDVSTDGAAGLGGTAHVWALAALFFGYFAGTVFYVKTNIRERGSTPYLFASVAWHAAWTAAVIALAMHDAIGRWHAVVWALMTARAVAVPLYGRIRTPLPVRAIGIGEILASIAFIVTLF